MKCRAGSPDPAANHIRSHLRRGRETPPYKFTAPTRRRSALTSRSSVPARAPCCSVAARAAQVAASRSPASSRAASPAILRPAAGGPHAPRSSHRQHASRDRAAPRWRDRLRRAFPFASETFRARARSRVFLGAAPGSAWRIWLSRAGGSSDRPRAQTPVRRAHLRVGVRIRALTGAATNTAGSRAH